MIGRYYYIDRATGVKTFVKELNYAEKTLTFTTNVEEAHTRNDGTYYIEHEAEWLRENWTDKYPQISNLTYEYDGY